MDIKVGQKYLTRDGSIAVVERKTNSSMICKDGIRRPFYSGSVEVTTASGRVKWKFTLWTPFGESRTSCAGIERDLISEI